MNVHQSFSRTASQRFAVAVLLILFVAAPAVGRDRGTMSRFAVGPDEGVEFLQVDFEFGDASFPDTNWGEVVVDPLVLTENRGGRPGFINVVLDEQWLVHNLLVDPRPPERGFRTQLVTPAVNPRAPNVSTYFDLGTGPRPNPMRSLLVKVLFTRRPLRTRGAAFALARRTRGSTFRVADSLVNAEGARGPTGVPDSPQTVAGPPPGPEPPFDPDLPLAPVFWHELPNPVNVECAWNQCVPMAQANNLQFLEATYGQSHSFSVPHAHIPGLRGDLTLVGTLDSLMMRGVTSRCDGDTTSRDQLIDGLFAYLSFLGGDPFVLRHQGGDPVYSKYGITSNRQGEQVTWQWLCEQIDAGRGVVITYGRYETQFVFDFPNLIEKYVRVGGHQLRLYGCGFLGGQRQIRTLDDSSQTRKSKYSDDCIESGGLRWTNWWLQDTNNDNRYNLSGTNRELETAWSIELLP